MVVQKMLLLLYLAAAAWLDMKRKEVSMTLWLYGSCILFAGSAAEIGLRTVCLGLMPGLVVLCLARASREAIGSGDGLVILCCGMVCGLWNTAWMILLALLLQMPFALYLIAVKKCGRKKEMAFVPFLLAGYLIIWALGC